MTDMQKVVECMALGAFFEAYAGSVSRDESTTASDEAVAVLLEKAAKYFRGEISVKDPADYAIALCKTMKAMG